MTTKKVVKKKTAKESVYEETGAMMLEKARQADMRIAELERTTETLRADLNATRQQLLAKQAELATLQSNAESLRQHIRNLGAPPMPVVVQAPAGLAPAVATAEIDQLRRAIEVHKAATWRSGPRPADHVLYAVLGK